MRVLHVLNTGGYSGAENVVISLIKSMPNNVEAAYASPDGVIREILSEEGIEFLPIQAANVNIKILRKLICDYKPDIIHAHDFLASVTAAIVGGKIPIISHLHNNPFWTKKICIWTVIYTCSSIRYKRILAVSNAVIDEFVFGKYLKAKSKIVGNPIDLQTIRDKAGRNTQTDKYDVIFLGRLSEPKNPVFFLEIVRDLVKRIPSVHVILVGDGELRDVISEKCKEFDLESNVKLYGFVKNPYSILQSSKVLCMPSRWEGFGLAAVEALTFGLPVVASPVGGLANIVTMECGKLCVEKEAYVDEIYKLLVDEQYYRKKSVKARERAEEFDNIDRYSKSIVEIYKEILNN